MLSFNFNIIKTGARPPLFTRVKEMRRECHPLLRVVRNRESKYSHGLSSAEMESLSSLCETILPSLSPTPELDRKQNQPTKAVHAFYGASGSQTPMPDEV